MKKSLHTLLLVGHLESLLWAMLGLKSSLQMMKRLLRMHLQPFILRSHSFSAFGISTRTSLQKLRRRLVRILSFQLRQINGERSIGRSLWVIGTLFAIREQRRNLTRDTLPFARNTATFPSLSNTSMKRSIQSVNSSLNRGPHRSVTSAIQLLHAVNQATHSLKAGSSITAMIFLILKTVGHQ